MSEGERGDRRDPPTASSFVPGHVTAFFSVHRRETPAETGSRGAGITLSDGVTVTVEPTEQRSLHLDGRQVEMAPVARVLDALGVDARVDAASDLPLGAGFGVSGATALGTAIAANHACSLGYSENELVEVAHVAEVEAGTGLGDVVAQARGGVPVRVEPGSPPHGALDGVPEVARLEWLSFGDLSTEEVISGDTATLSEAGGTALAELLEGPTLPRLFRGGREFARDAGLLIPEVETVVEAVVDAGGEATMAMLGRSVVALDDGLSEAGYDPSSCRVHSAGATLEE